MVERAAVADALKSDRSMWLSTVRRAEPTDPVPNRQLVFALRFIAAQRESDTLTRSQYRDTREEAVAADEARRGDDALLGRLLPTLNQIDGQVRWKKRSSSPACASRQHRRVSRPGSTTSARVCRPRRPMAFYAALMTGGRHASGYAGSPTTASSRWPTSRASTGKASCGTHGRSWKPRACRHRHDGPKSLGKGKRLSYRYPANGIPGTPPPSRVRQVALIKLGEQRLQPSHAFFGDERDDVFNPPRACELGGRGRVREHAGETSR